MTLAVDAADAWIACKEQSRVIRVDPKSGRVESSLRLDAPVIAVALGYGSLWAVDSSSTLYRIRPATARVAKRIQLGAAAAYNIWVGGGSVWVADDQAAQVIRVAPATGKVVRRIAVGDGPASMAFSGRSAWVVNHRDRRLDRIDLATNMMKRLGTIPGDAPERIAWLGGSLWITGRGTDLIRVDPQTGGVRETIEVGAGGIDVVAGDGALWVPVRSAVVDPTGFPTMEALRRVDASTGQVTTAATATARVDVHGLRAFGGSVWLADNRAGVVYRLRM
jgi:streptogramin lyase